MLDVETLFGLVLKEEDADTKHIYYFLFKLLRKSILASADKLQHVKSSVENNQSSQNTSLNSDNLSESQHNQTQATPTKNFKKHCPTSVEAHLGRPPFEEPSVTKCIINFLFSKFGKAGDHELKNMLEVTKLFLYCMNMWKFETPNAYAKRCQSNQLAEESHSSKLQKLVDLYTLSYTRWMCYNFVPSFCDSLEKFETIGIFGLSFLKLVYPIIRQELYDKFAAEKDKIPAESRVIFASSLPK